MEKNIVKCFLCMLSSYCEHNSGPLKNINFFIKEQFRPRILSPIRRAGGGGGGGRGGGGGGGGEGGAGGSLTSPLYRKKCSLGSTCSNVMCVTLQIY
jgi:hypothetical protein